MSELQGAQIRHFWPKKITQQIPEHISWNIYWFDLTKRIYIFSYDVCSALHWLNNGVMLIHSGRWPLIIFSWADRETKSWCNFWAADWKKLKRNLNAHRPDLLVFLILLKMSWQPLAQTCLGTLLVYQGGKLFRVPKPTPTDMSLCCFQTRQGPPTAC